MVRLVTLDEDGLEEGKPHYPRGDNVTSTGQEYDNRPNPNYDLKFSAALSCYPVISSIASCVDLTTLHDLSRTCRQFRANLLQHRQTLIDQTLRCKNENANPALRLGNALQASFTQWTTYAATGEKIGRVSGGKVGACARDMVGDCRKCGETVCRNCVIKQPTVNVLKGRFRRLCRTCMKSNVGEHTVADDPAGEVVARSPMEGSEPDYMGSQDGQRKVIRTPCTCDELLWICKPCGQTVRPADTTYMRGWAWRTRYSACGGIGAGLGEGNEGVECGRGGACLDKREVEHEIEYDAEEVEEMEAEMGSKGIDGRTWAGSSYRLHEVVGIGGTIKMIVKKCVKVGAIVKEYEDERVTKTFLKREQDRANRSWCSWCDRVALGRKDADRPGKSSDSIASSSSEASWP